MSFTNQFELTAEEEDALQSFYWRQPSGFIEGDFQDAWIRRKAHLTAIELQPYSDLLFGLIVHDLDIASISSRLTEKCTTASHVRELSVPIWEFKHCDMPYNYHYIVGTVGHRHKLAVGDPDAKKVQLITNHGLRGLISSSFLNVETGDREYEFAPQEIMRIFSKTDIKERLALHFGGRNFRISLERRVVRPSGIVEDDGIYPLVVSVMLHYYPHGVSEHERKWLGKAALKYRHYIPAYHRNPFARACITDGKKLLHQDDDE